MTYIHTQRLILSEHSLAVQSLVTEDVIVIVGIAQVPVFFSGSLLNVLHALFYLMFTLKK